MKAPKQEINTYSLFLNGVIYSKSESIKSLRNHCGFITGFPSNSNSAITLCSYLLKKGGQNVYYKGEKVLVTLKVETIDY